MDCRLDRIGGSCIDTVRALHQTINSLREALEASRSEISELKSRKLPIGTAEDAVKNLSIENHLLRRRLLKNNDKNQTKLHKSDENVSKLSGNEAKTVSFSNLLDGNKQNIQNKRLEDQKENSYLIFKQELLRSKIRCSTSNLSLPEKKPPEKERRSSILGKEVEAALLTVFSDRTKLDEPAKKQSPKPTIPDVDKTETDCLKKALKEVEVSVTISKKPKQPIEIDIQTKSKRKSKMTEKKPEVPPLDLTTLDDPENLFPENEDVDDIELIFTTDETKETDFKEELAPIENYLPVSDYDEKISNVSDRELEDDVFNDNFEDNSEKSRNDPQIYASKSDNSINHEEKSFKSYYDSSFENKSLEKDESFDRFEEKVRIVETDMSKIGIQDTEYNSGRRNTCPNPIQYRPIMHREALGRNANPRKPKPVLSHVRRDSGAQTDISAIPGSSWRSESSLAHKVKIGENFPTLPSKFPHPGSRLRLSEKTVEARRILLSDIGFTSMVPELSRSADHLCNPNVSRPVSTTYGQFLRTTDLYSPAYTSQRFAWNTTTPSEGSYSQSRYSSQYPLLSPPTQSRRCSAPVSPSKRTNLLKSTPSRVRFANGSLPELRTDWTAGDSGDSTDSLVEEAEHYLRRSIDCVAHCRDNCFKGEMKKSHGPRRASAPEPARDNVPPQGWQPFLPRMARDLHLDYWVKVISPEGRVRGGRVRYVGPLMNQPESFIGVQLSTPDGQSDGTHSNRRYFNCEPYHGLFVPFKKIIMGWRP